MFITKDHFISPFARVIKNKKIQSMLQAVDTDLMVATRVVGMDNDGQPIIDLVKVDKVCFITEGMPSHLQDLIPANFELFDSDEHLKKTLE